MSKILVISNNLTIKKIFQLISNKLKIDFVFKNSLVNSIDFDIVVLDDSIEHNDIKLTLLNSTKSFGLLASNRYVPDDDLSYKFILKKPFLPQQLFNVLKNELDSLKNRPQKPLINTVADSTIDDTTEFLNDKIEVDFNDDIEFDNLGENDTISSNSEPKINTKKISDELDWESDLDFLMNDAIDETSKDFKDDFVDEESRLDINSSDKEVLKKEDESSKIDSIDSISELDDINEKDLAFVDDKSILNEYKEDDEVAKDLNINLDKDDLKVVLNIVSKYEDLDIISKSNSIKINIK